MPPLPLRTPCLCVKPSPLSPLICGLSAVGCELSFPLSPLFATLAGHTQIAGNKTTLSPFPATLTSRVKHKSFVCHSYEKHRGVGWHIPYFAHRSPLLASPTHRSTRNSNPLMRLRTTPVIPGGKGYVPRHRPANSDFRLQVRLLRVTSHESPVTTHEPTHL